ncbi:MAG: carboxypeptidase-like regulatory domain-containing protein, partial [Acidobacteriota bacterium]
YTDSTGFYKVRGLKDGRYTVVIENAEKRFIKVVDIPRVKEFRYDILYPEHEISGRVIDGETRMPIPFARVDVWSEELGDKGIVTFDIHHEVDGVASSITAATSEMQSTTTDSEGFFSFLIEREGKYSVTVVSPGYIRKVIPVAIVQNIPPLEIALVKGATLRGTVRSEKGAIPPAADIQMIKENHSSGTSIDAGGRFVFDDLEPGNYSLYIFAPALAPLILDDFKIEPGRHYVEDFMLKEGAPLKIGISPADLPVRIRILDAAGHDFYSIFLMYLEEEISIEEGKEKTAYLFPNLPPGPYRITVTSKKATKEEDVEIFSGSPATVEFEF